MGVDIETSIDIDRPRKEVAAFAEDPSNARIWYRNIESVEWHGPPRVEVGARVDFVARFLGHRLAYTYEIVDHEPHRLLRMRTSQGPFPMETTYRWEDRPSGATRMTLRNRGRPSGFRRVAAPLVAAAVRSANAKDLAALKAHLESEGGS